MDRRTRRLHRLGWGWAPLIGARLERPERGERMLFSRLQAMGGSGRAAAAADRAGRSRPTRARKLDRLTGRAEPREGQRAMAEAVTAGVRAQARRRTSPNLLLAEAGTGIGKTLAYLAPAVAVGRAGRAARCGCRPSPRRCSGSSTPKGPKLFADADERARRIVVRKGRENYLCLLNLEDALQGAFAGRAAILAQLVGRWAAYTKDGDMVGGDLPGWLPSLFRRAGAAALTDRRGECVYAGCPHYRRCFIERAERASREADIVIANHALVMVNAARAPRGRAGADPVRRGPSSVRRRRFDLRGRVRRAGSDRAAALDRRAGGPLARAAARACGAADGRRFL